MMNTPLLYLTKEEKTFLSLRTLYKQLGYASFKMSQFEEYDLYVKNKEFLIGDSVMTFTDTDGRLLALKPDVTLSIVKNFKGREGELGKYCYNERIYRFSREKHGFTELLQSGIECLGAVDLNTTAEVVLLALESLSKIGESYLLELSHIAITKELIASITDSEEVQRKIFHAIGEKNLHELRYLCSEVDEALLNTILDLLALRGQPSEVLAKLHKMPLPLSAMAGVQELEDVCRILEAQGVNGIVLDFSLVSDVRYYSGILFRGYVNGVPERVLSGGRYDLLMKRMGKNGAAIGFAVYLNTLERFGETNDDFDVDTFLLYCDDDDALCVAKALDELRRSGISVCAGKVVPSSLSYRRIVDVKGREVKIHE